MIKLKHILLLVAGLLLGGMLFAQVPQTFSFQEVVRYSNNKLLKQKPISVRVNILQGSEDGNSVYEEIQHTTTNVNGAISIEIGAGQSDQNFSEINWAQGPYFIMIEVDPTGNNEYYTSSVSKIQSVPYAFYANKSGLDREYEYSEILNAPTSLSEFTNDVGYITTETDSAVYQWAKADEKPVYDYSEIQNAPDTSVFIATETDPNVAAWAKAENKPVYDISEIQNVPEQQTISLSNGTISLSGGSSVELPPYFSGDYSDLSNKPNIPENLSALNNDLGFVANEADPGVSDWAKTEEKPEYQYSEIQNTPSEQTIRISNDTIYLSGDSGVSFVKLPDPTENDFSGDYNDLTNTPEIPTLTSQLTNGAGFLTAATVPAQENADWNAEEGTAAYIDNKPTIPVVPTNISELTNDAGYFTQDSIRAQEKADWNAEEGTAAYIDNKPTIPVVPTNISELTNDAGFIVASDVPAQENADWEAEDGVAEILNKPVIPASMSQLTNDAGYITAANIPDQENADWNAEEGTVAYIDNKPTIPSVPTNVSEFTNDAGFIVASDVPAQENADWNATEGVAEILNKPTLPTVPDVVSYFENDANYITEETNTLAQVAALGNSVNTQLKNVTNPTDAQDVSTKAYVDSLANALKVAITEKMKIHESIDLGLPSGLKWATYNVGASGPSELGDYFAWGETEPKTEYSSETNTYTERPSTLPSTADAASLNWGKGWRMATSSEWSELRNSCTWEWRYQNGHYGYLVTGPNGNSMFLPAAGYYSGEDLRNLNSEGVYWTSSFGSGFPYYIQISSEEHYMGALNRYYGYSVRAVCNDNSSLETLPTVTTKQAEVVNATYAECGGEVIADGGAEVTARGVCWTLDMTSMPTVDDNHTDDGTGVGQFAISLSDLTPNTTYYYRAYATNSVGTAYGSLRSFTTVSETPGPSAPSGTNKGHGYVDLGLSVKWAYSNVGAESPEGIGTYYSWGETRPKENYINTNYNYTPTPTTLADGDDAATANWNGSWRMPTMAEMEELVNSCTWTWTTQGTTNGYLVTGPNGKSIFIPVSGYRYETDYTFRADGFLWTKTISDRVSITAQSLHFTSESIIVSTIDRASGLQVRAVFDSSSASVTTGQVSRITSNSVLCDGEVSEVGGSSVTARGFCWTLSATKSPSVSDDHTTEGSGSGSFQSTITGLYANTTYYVRAYATNASGTTYGEMVSFTTAATASQDGYDYVDLGLSSGLKWATCNVGATSQEEAGNYYAWGETSVKDTYGSGNYVYADTPTTLPASADAVAVNMGGNWRMPTKENYEELRSGCTWTWTSINGKNGYIIVGSNGNRIFLPASGYKGTTIINFNDYGYYWTSTIMDAENAYALYFYNGSRNLYDFMLTMGRPVRGVCQ